MRVVPIAALIAAMLAAAPPTRQAEPTEVWRVTLDDGAAERAAWSPAGTCVAVATGKAVHVLDAATGAQQWSWAFPAVSAYLHPQSGSPFAVAPTCDEVALGGTPSYKYLWTADRSGRTTVFQTKGTPARVKFAVNGNSLALSTYAPYGYLLDRRLKVRWEGQLSDLPAAWNGEARPKPSATIFLRRDLDDLFNIYPPYGTTTTESADGQWQLLTRGPFRGRAKASLELWGPDATGSTGLRWTKPLGCPGAVFSTDATLVLAVGNPVVTEYAEFAEACGQRTAYVFDRDGRSIAEWPYEGNVAEDVNWTKLAEDFSVRTGRSFARLRELDRWSVPFSLDDGQHHPSTWEYSPDDHQLFASIGREVRLYRRQ